MEHHWKIIPGEKNLVGICDRLNLTLQAPTWAEMMEEIDLVEETIKHGIHATDREHS